MDWLINGLIDALVAFLCKVLASAMDFVTGIFSSALGADPTLFREVFPITESLQQAFMAVGFGLAIGLVMFGCFRNMFSGLGWAGEKPFQMVIRFLIAVMLVFLLPSIMSYFYYQTEGGGSGLFKTIYDGIGEIESDGTSTYGFGFFNVVSTANFIFTKGVSKIVSGIILLILMTVIAINFVKLLIEMFERYLLLNFLIFMSPLAASAVTLESTMKIFSSYIKMFIGQMLMMLMNLISLKIVSSGMSIAGSIIGGGVTIEVEGIGPEFMPFVVLLLIIAMLKILQRVDNYARDIGLTVGITGGNLMDDIIGTAAVFKPVVSALTGGALGGGKGGKSSGGSSSGSEGFANSPVGRMFNSSIAGAVVNGIGDTAKGFKSAQNKTGLDHPTMVDMFKHYGQNGGMKGFMQDVKEGAQASKVARMGVPDNNLASNFKKAWSGNADDSSKAMNGITGMMSNSTPVSFSASTARGTQVAFRSFADNLSVAEGESGAVGIGDLSHVSVGVGGAIGTNDAGDMIALTNYQPLNTDSSFTTSYQDSNGQTYWAQNLSEANRASLKETGKEYDVYRQAQKAINTGNTNYNFAGANISNDAPNVQGSSVSRGTTVNNVPNNTHNVMHNTMNNERVDNFKNNVFKDNKVDTESDEWFHYFGGDK